MKKAYLWKPQDLRQDERWRHSCWQASHGLTWFLGLLETTKTDGEQLRCSTSLVCVCVCARALLALFSRSRSGVFNRTPTRTRSRRQTHTHARTGRCRHGLCVRHHTKSFPVLLHISDWNTVTNCWHSSSYNQPCIHCPAACIQTHTKEALPFIWYFLLLPTQVTF